MHISEGVISAPILFTSGTLTAAGCAVGLKKLDYDRMAQVGILSAAFFMASLIHVPIGPSSVHLLLNGILGLLLGWGAFYGTRSKYPECGGSGSDLLLPVPSVDTQRHQNCSGGVFCLWSTFGAAYSPHGGCLFDFHRR